MHYMQLSRCGLGAPPTAHHGSSSSRDDRLDEHAYVPLLAAGAQHGSPKHRHPEPRGARVIQGYLQSEDCLADSGGLGSGRGR